MTKQAIIWDRVRPSPGEGVAIHGVLLTRFNVRNQHSGTDDHMLEWTKRRTDIFERVCLPSIVQQVRRPQRWLIGVHAREAEIGGLRELVADHPWIELVPQIIDAARGPQQVEGQFARIIAETLPTGNWLLSARTDNDDALGLSYFAAMTAYAQAVIAGQPDVEDFWLAPPIGAQLVDGTFRQFQHAVPHFLARCSSPAFARANRPLVNQINHGRVFAEGRTVFSPLTNRPVWLEYVHGGNIYNVAHAGLPVYRDGAQVASWFGLAPDVAQLPPKAKPQPAASAPARPLTEAQRAAARASRERMMKLARERGRVWRYRLHAALVMPFIWLLGALPVDTASRVGAWLGRRLIPRLSDTAGMLRNMRVAFPGTTDAQAASRFAAMGENIGRVFGESLHLAAFAGPGNPRLVIEGAENIEAARAEGGGVLFIGGHFANWELFEVALARLGLEGAKVLQHPSNPYVLEFIAHRRYAHGLDEQIATGEGVFVRVRDALNAGRVVQMLADQRTRKGAKVPFFGVETVTNLVPARAARETGAAVILMSMRRLKGARFAIKFHPARRFDADDDEVAIMAWVNSFYEARLRRQPWNWLWGHPRFNDVWDNRAAEPFETPPPVNGR